MSWQLGAAAILGLALAGGFAWYERSRPDARIVALVATLAAAAALGRIAFAALPNVKPTTDIVLISGYALGGAPGFAVGAIAGLTSNFFFGQGPWTPWQMAAWGATGLVGAGLAQATRGRIGRWPLAAVCGIVGFAFVLTQDVGDWVNYSDHSLAQLGAYAGKGIGFDFVHAAGCVAFALAIGPAMIHSLQRFAQRLQVTWGPLAGAATLSLVLALAIGGAVALATPSPTSYLLAAQNRDGGFGPAPGAASSTLYSGWAALGLASAGHNPADVSHGGASLLSYVESGAGSLTDPGAIERSILVAHAAGVDPHSFGGHDLVAALERHVRRDGSVGDQVNLTSFAVFALRAAGVGLPSRMLGWLARQQDADGGFNFATAGGASDVDDTGAALQALVGAPRRELARAVRFIERQQNRDGGFPAQPGQPSNAQSTAWAVQGLVAAGVDPAGLHRRGAPSPLTYLQTLAAADGHIRYARASDQTPVWVTAQALMALEGKQLPLAPVARAPHAAHPVRRAHGRPARGRGSRRGEGGRSARRAASRRVASPARRAARSPALTGLTTDAAILTALALAPMGI